MTNIKMINYANVDPKLLGELFKKNGIFFPRSLRIDALRKAIESKFIEERDNLLKTEKEESNEMGIKDYIRLNRLNNYVSLSEFQLENDFEYYNDVNINQNYLHLFWEALSELIKKLENAKDIFEQLSKLKIIGSIDNIKILDYNLYFKSQVLDEVDYFDGIHLVETVKHFEITSVASEIRLLAKKYDIFIPKYWNKADLQLKIKQELDLKKLLTKRLLDKIDNSSVKNLKIMMDEMKLESRTHITKADMIELIIRNVDKNKVTEIAKKETAKEFAPIIEEEDEKNMQTNPVVVPTKDIDYTDLIKQVIENQEFIIEELKNRQDNVIDKSNEKRDKIFNIVVIGLIILVSLIWITYGVSILFR